MALSRMHPVANWIHLPPGDQRRALDRVLAFRDQQLEQDPSASGLPPAAVEWFWESDLPALIRRPEVRCQVEQHLQDLIQQAADLDQQINRQAGSLLDRLQQIQGDVARLQEVLA
jgi:hypothetical protein